MKTQSWEGEGEGKGEGRPQQLERSYDSQVRIAWLQTETHKANKDRGDISTRALKNPNSAQHYMNLLTGSKTF